MADSRSLAGLPVLTEGSEGLSEREAFTALYHQYRRLVRSVIYQIVGREALDDLVQETFMRIWKGLPSFRNDASLSSWIYRVSTNTALDYFRGRARIKTDPDISVAESLALEGSDHSRETETRDIVMKGLGTLSSDHRMVLVLAFLHELPLAEVADIVGVSEGTVKSRLHYAKSAFREFLATEGIEL